MANSIDGLSAGFEALGLRQADNAQQKSKGLDQDAFLELMVTQLNNQDPMNPMESGDFLGQLAQFGTVNGISQLQTAVSSLASSLQSSQALQASTMVGRTVLVPGNQSPVLPAAGGIAGAVELSEPAANLSIAIQDGAGQTVKTLSMGAQPTGLAQFQWDGLDDAGNAVPAGNYRISAEAQVNGQNVSFATLLRARVDSVSLLPGGAGTQLNLGVLGTVGLEDVREVM